jgi:hypothetical protein
MNRNTWLRTTAAAVLATSGLAGLAWVPIATAGGERCRLTAIEAALETQGPPLICHPFDIGDAKSIAFGKDAFDGQKGYKPREVVGDTLKVLKTERSVIVRMETLRRATVYLRDDANAARELLGKLAWMALDAESASDAASTSPTAWRAQAWFDAGYFAASLSHLGVDIDWNPGVAEGVKGYAWIRKAIELSGNNPSMEFAAALATHPGMRDSKRDLFEQHIRNAAAGADTDPLLARNLKGHLANWGESLDTIVAKGK